MRIATTHLAVGLLSLRDTMAWLQSPLAVQRLQREVISWPLFESPDLDGDDDLMSPQQSDARREQEIMMEESSLKGAAQIAKMDIPERAKRAMLAEVVEDRIFELTDILEGLIEEDGSVRVENREKAVQMASQIKERQQQYSDLVNGQPSTILTALSSSDKDDTGTD